MIDERELSDIKRWHYYEGGLDNRGQVINRMIESIDSLLKIARAAQAYESNEVFQWIGVYGKKLGEALKSMPPVEDKEPWK